MQQRIYWIMLVLASATTVFAFWKFHVHSLRWEDATRAIDSQLSRSLDEELSLREEEKSESEAVGMFLCMALLSAATAFIAAFGLHLSF